MLKRVIFGVAATLMATQFSSAAALAGAGEAPTEPALFGALPSVSDVEISPDGKVIAVLQNDSGMTAVVFYFLDQPDRSPRVTLVGKAKARDLVWVSDEHVLLLVSNHKKQGEYWRWVAISPSSE